MMWRHALRTSNLWWMLSYVQTMSTVSVAISSSSPNRSSGLRCSLAFAVALRSFGISASRKLYATRQHAVQYVRCE